MHGHSHRSAVVDKCCPEDGCAAASLLSVPCQGQSQGSSRRRPGAAKELGHVVGVLFVVVGMNLDLSATVGISMMFFKTDLGWGLLCDI